MRTILRNSTRPGYTYLSKKGLDNTFTMWYNNIVTMKLIDERYTMSYYYDKYKSMSAEKLQKAIDERVVTVQYLNWLGISGQGMQLRELSKMQLREIVSQAKEN
tara:strand:+ start:627 stop:938 length:312 start_codon:yes stop_codon:yes gene_type:complete